MKKVNVNMKRIEICRAAKELEIRFAGVPTEKLVELVNAKIAEKPAKVKPTLEGVGFKLEQHVQIDGSKLSGRGKNLNGRVAVIKEITSRGFIRAILVNNKNGQLQGCLVRFPIEALIAIEEPIQTVA